jgi:hypothetical protein
VLDPEQSGIPLRQGDYVVMRGTLWQDSYHVQGSDTSPTEWDAAPPTKGHGGWLEIHPVDWLVRVQGPSTIARLSGRSLALCTEDAVASQEEGALAVSPEFAPSRQTAALQVRTVTALVDHRFTVAYTVTENSFTSRGDYVETAVRVQARDGSQGRFKGSWQVAWREVDRYDRPWPGFDDELPATAQPFSTGDTWDWRTDNPRSFSGTRAHHSALLPGVHQHGFQGPYLSERAPGDRDLLFAHVYLDAENPPDEVMLQWLTDDGWEHRVFWGADMIGWGTAGSASRLRAGRLPYTDEWVRLEVPAACVNVAGQRVRGLAFTLFGGRAAWDYAGVRSSEV